MVPIAPLSALERVGVAKDRAGEAGPADRQEAFVRQSGQRNLVFDQPEPGCASTTGGRSVAVRHHASPEKKSAVECGFFGARGSFSGFAIISETAGSIYPAPW
jgi:hypothetical protein